MQKICTNPWCRQSFEVTQDELMFLDTVSPVIAGRKEALPPPPLCPQCRLVRRLSFYNCRSLYRRTCDHSKKSIVSMFSPDKPFTVYEKDFWFSDGWDPLSYGKAFDFKRPFFPQFRELMCAVPLQSLSIIGPDNINSDYTNDNYKLKNCYLVFDGEQAEDCYHGQTFTKIRNCCDFVALWESELCYECVHCTGCYHLRFGRYCFSCSDSWFLRDCIGCRDCFGCVNLRQKQYCIFNEQKTREEYGQFLAGFLSASQSALSAMQERVDRFFLTKPVKALRGEQNINVHGDNIFRSKNAFFCFDCNDQQDTCYCTDCGMSTRDCRDIHIWGDGLELSYDCCCVGAGARNLLFDYYVSQNCTDVLYSLFCSHGCRNLFGCVGLRRRQYCIFNVQYTEEEYGQLVSRIIAHMRQSGEWGQFFPQSIALFGYNETMANIYFPEQKEHVLERGWQWSDYEVAVEAQKVIDAAMLPDNLNAIPDDVLHWAIRCSVTGKPFKIVKQELDFYRNEQLPLPRLHPDERHRRRYALKNPYRLWNRHCMKCRKEIETTYAPERPEIVYCENCYLKEVY